MHTLAVGLLFFGLCVLGVAVATALYDTWWLRRKAQEENRIDPVKWRPLMMSFSRFFGLGPELRHSRLAEIPESRYAPQGVAPSAQGHTGDSVK